MHLAFPPNILIFPNEVDKLQNQAKFFELYGFPKVLGSIDGTHVPILAPPCDEDLFVNRENFHSVDIQAICDSDPSANPLRPNLLTPIKSPVKPSERRHNKVFLKTRKTIECAFRGGRVDGNQQIKLDGHFATYQIVFVDQL